MADRLLLGGGIGSGKSTAAACFAALGAVVVSADLKGHEVIAPGTPGAARVLEAWPEVADAGGAVDRRLLGEIVFADPVALRALESITHPLIRTAILHEEATYSDRVVVVEVPIPVDLPGRGWPWVVVDATDDLRLHRAAGRGGMTEALVRKVMASQPERGEWLALAQWVIDNSGDLAALEEQCRRVWDEAVTAVD